MPPIPKCPNCHRNSFTKHVYGDRLVETFEIVCKSRYCTFQPSTLDRTEEGARARWFEAVNDKWAERLLKHHKRVSNG